MNRFHATILTTLLFFASICLGGNLIAQDGKKANVKKELTKILKDLPEDAQMQILRYAQRKRDALKAAEAKKAEAEAALTANKTKIKEVATVKPQQDMAMPQPAPAKPVEIKAAPSANTIQSEAKVPPKPTLPSYVQEAKEMAQTNIEFPEVAYNYGKVKSGDMVTHTFRFTNTGDAPLKLTRVKASCGCTTPKWSNDLIQPGEEGFIDVSFNTTGKAGVQTKTITVTGNFSGNNKVLRITGEVERATPAGGQ